MATPPTPISGDDLNGVVKDGFIASILGGLAMVSRLLMSTEPVSFGWVVRRVTAAAITAALVGYALQDYIASPALRMAATGACGYSAPELLDYGMKMLKARANKEIGAVTKTNGKAKRPAKAKRRK